jgi:hypothetical protein
MKDKIAVKYIFSFSLCFSILIIFFGRYLNPVIEKILSMGRICETHLGDYSCYNWDKIILLTFFSFTISIFFVSILLFSSKEEAYIRWQKFSKFALPIMLMVSLFIALGIKPQTGGYFDMGSINGILIFIPAIVFILISIFILFKQKLNRPNQLI